MYSHSYTGCSVLCVPGDVKDRQTWFPMRQIYPTLLRQIKCMKHKKLKENLHFSETRISFAISSKRARIQPDSCLDPHLITLPPSISLLKLLLKPGNSNIHSSSEILPQKSRMCSWPPPARTAMAQSFSLSADTVGISKRAQTACAVQPFAYLYSLKVSAQGLTESEISRQEQINPNIFNQWEKK